MVYTLYNSYVCQILALMIAFPLILRVLTLISDCVDPLFWLLKFGMIISQFLTRFVKNVIGFDLSGNSSITEGFHSSWTSIVKTIIFLIGCIVSIGPTSPLENRLHESKWVWEWVISGKHLILIINMDKVFDIVLILDIQFPHKESIFRPSTHIPVWTIHINVMLVFLSASLDSSAVKGSKLKRT